MDVDKRADASARYRSQGARDDFGRPISVRRHHDMSR